MVVTVGVGLGSAQIIGTREEQQDAFGFSDQDDLAFVQHGGVMAVVADGIGGHAHGGEASQVAVREFLQVYSAKPKQASISDALYQSLQMANRAVRDFAEDQGESNNCGTTLVAAALHPASHSLFWISSGDSRLYLVRDKQCVQITSDCNYASQRIRQIAQGVLTGNELTPDVNSQSLTSFLGLRKLDAVDRGIRPFKIRSGDSLVLCTDGIYGSLSPEEFAECIRVGSQESCDALIQAVLAKSLKKQDNATVAIMTYGPIDTSLDSLPGEPMSGEEALERQGNVGGQPKPAKTSMAFKRLLSLGVAAAVLLAIWIGIVWLGGSEELQDLMANRLKAPDPEESSKQDQPDGF